MPADLTWLVIVTFTAVGFVCGKVSATGRDPGAGDPALRCEDCAGVEASVALDSSDAAGASFG